jgi:hypothetical protein
LLGSGVVTGGLGTDRGQDRSGQCIGGGSDGGFVIASHDRTASGFMPTRGSSMPSIPLRSNLDVQYARSRSW